MRSTSQSIVQQSQDRIAICMQALKDVSRVWLVAKMVHTLFESILGNKVLEERLQKAAGKRHQKNRQQQAAKATTAASAAPAQPQPQASKPEPPKRKYDDMELGFSNGRPAPQVSYERSRPQTPAQTPSRDLGHSHSHSQSMAHPHPGHHSPPPPANNNNNYAGTAGNSRANTRPTTPFQMNYSVPATPPDLFLVTRNSPNISQYLWENFQPEQLFPDSTSMLQSFSPQTTNVDPALQQLPPGMQQPQPMLGIPQQPRRPSQQLPPQQQEMGNMHSIPVPTMGAAAGVQGMQQQQTWPMQAMGTGVETANPDDNWSNSSRGAPPVPTTLNVEDWYVLLISLIDLWN